LRILGWYLVFLCLALAFGLILQRQILLTQLDDSIDAQLVQEVEELQALSEGRDPETGEAFGSDAAAIFRTFLSRNIPVEGEALFTIVDGQPFASTVAPVQLLDEPSALAAWTGIDRSTRGEFDTAEGKVRYLAVPLRTDGAVTGVFVVTIFMQSKLDDVNGVLRVALFVYGSLFLVASMLAWFAAGRELRPIRLLTEAAREVRDDNWRARIPARGDGEILELTRTFNEMLDRLEDSFATQRRFIDDAGHELRTPITIVRGHLELLDGRPEERAETVRLVTDELDRMSRMVDDLLLLARYETPDFLQTEPIDVEDLTNEIGHKVIALGDGAVEVGESARLVMVGDRHRLTQAVMNLVRNAFEHNPPGTRVAIGSRAVGRDVEFWVADDGSGIPVGEQERIFERFARGGSGRRRTDGAGLGLAIVRAIAEAHGGQVELRSQPMGGTRFAIVVPVDREEPRR